MKNSGPPIRPKHIIEYAALRGFAALLNVLPHRGALLAGWVIAALAFHVFRFRVAEALRRIHGVFGERFSDRERRRIAWQSWRNTVFNAVELLRIPRLTPARLAQRADYSACLNAIKRHTDTGQGAVIAVPHMGNWELAGIGCLFAGIPIFNIAARQRNPLVNAFFNRLRSSPGIETLERGTDTMRTVIRNLKSGMALAILPDARMNEGGMALPFLGGQANLGTGMALFARHAGVPIFPCVVIRIGWTRHQAHGFPPLWPDRTIDKKADIERLTAAVVQLMDKVIQEHPEQWFWFNKRWVLDP